MAKDEDEYIRMRGTVLKMLPDSTFEVKLESGFELLAKLFAEVLSDEDLTPPVRGEISLRNQVSASTVAAGIALIFSGYMRARRPDVVPSRAAVVEKTASVISIRPRSWPRHRA